MSHARRREVERESTGKAPGQTSCKVFRKGGKREANELGKDLAKSSCPV